MSDTKGKVNLLDTVPVQCGHITTEWEGEYAILSFPRFKYDWMRRFLLPKSMSADIHVKLEEHGTAVWRLIDGNRTVQEIISLLTDHFQNEDNYPSRVTTYIAVAERWIHSVESRELKVTVWYYNADCFQLSTLNFLIAFSVYLD